YGARSLLCIFEIYLRFIMCQETDSCERSRFASLSDIFWIIYCLALEDTHVDTFAGKKKNHGNTTTTNLAPLFQDARWSLNGTLINLGLDRRRRLSGGNLIISNLDRYQDVGMYQCMAYNTVGAILSRRASLQFAYLDHFKVHTRSAVSVREGQGVVLLCGTPTSSGDLTYAWVFNEYPYFVQQDSRRFVSQQTGNLYIAKVEPSDVGNYTCVVMNSITKGKVHSSPTSLILRTDVNFPDNVPAAKGSTVTLECFALGNPVPEITWRRANGVPFPSKVKMKYSNAVLEIPSFQQDDTGGYECVAENKMGKNTAAGRIDISVSSAKPQWIQTMKDTALAIEERLYWECRANGKPKPSYIWLKNGQQLLSEGRIHVEDGVLSVSVLTLSDAGMYQCVAENKHGIIYFAAELMVLASPPDFTGNVLRALLKAKAGTTVTLDCKPKAYPTSFSLLFLFGRSYRITLSPDGTLRLANLSKSDAGSYTCFARNRFGMSSTTGRLLVTDPTRIIQGPVDMEIIVGESIVLPCQVSSDPVLDVSFSWAFNGHLITNGDGHFELVGGQRTAGDLMIRNIQLYHAGKYICVVDTDVESLSAVAVLIVKGPPSPPDSVTVEEVTDSTAQLAWSPGRDNGSPISNYLIQTRTLFTVGWQRVNAVPEVIDGSTLTATVVDLNAWVEYEFRVLAKNSVGVGEPSPVSVKTRTEDAVPDAAPGDVGGGGGSRSELVITWEPVPEELQNGESFGYIIAFRAFGEVSWTHVATSAPGASRYVYRNESIAPFSPFHVKVGTYNSKGQGPFSPVVTIYSAETEPSGMPAGVWARSVSASEIEVNWQALPITPERVLGYEVLFTHINGNRYHTQHNSERSVHWNHTSVTVHSLAGNTQYFLTVSAFNTAGTGPFLPAINVTTKKPREMEFSSHQRDILVILKRFCVKVLNNLKAFVYSHENGSILFFCE
uniref:Contactin 3 n=1 Tax=Nothobranchius furzeri TaxID=105023 RepID=A0A8C6Q6H9_NOTFU